MPCRTPRARPCATSCRASTCRPRRTQKYPVLAGTSAASCRKKWAWAEAKELCTHPGYQPFHVAILRHLATLTLQATHEKTLEHVPLETLMRYAIDADEAQAEVTRIDELRAQLAKGVSFEAE